MDRQTTAKVDIEAELARLQALIAEQRTQIEEQRARLDQLDNHIGLQEPENGDRHSRRDLLKLAAAAAAGAAGSVALGAIPAAATSGSAIIAGQSNTADATTTLTTQNANQVVSPLLNINNNGAAAGSVALLIEGSNTGNAIFSQNAGNGGGAVVGLASAAGYGLIGVSSSGIDAYAAGNGRVAQWPTVQYAPPTGTGSPAGSAPPFTPGIANAPGDPNSVFAIELVRGDDGSIWAMRATGGNPLGVGTAAWRRMNSVRVDSAAGDGAPFAPVRLIDTRDPLKNGGHPGPLTSGQSYDFGPFTGSNGIPSDALGIVGNLTAVAAAPYPSQFAAQGYLAIYPKGTVRNASSPSNVNFGGPVYAWPNSFTVGFGSGANAGSVSIFVFGTAVHVILDVFAYIQ